MIYSCDPLERSQTTNFPNRVDVKLLLSKYCSRKSRILTFL